VLDESALYLTEYQRCITPRGLKESASKLVPAGSVLIGTRVGVGKTAVTTQDIAISQDLTAFVPKADVSPEYVALLLKSPPYARWFDENKRGTTIKGVTREDVMRLVVLLPSFPEQRAIAAVLRTVRRAKEGCDGVIAATRQLKASLLEYLFTYGSVRFDQADRVELKKTQVGVTAKRWPLCALADVGERVFGGGTPSTVVPEYWDGDIPWTTSAVLSEDALRLTRYQRLITARGLAESSSQVAPPGSVLIGTRVGVGKTAVTTFAIAISQDLTAFVPRVDVSSEYVAWLLRSPSYSRWFDENKRGTTIKGVARQDVMQLTVPRPLLSEQQRIADILSAADAKLAVEERKRTALEAMFQSLLHHLMTGKVRLPEFAPSNSQREE
jgi:type I restriction enzyme S subunit